MMDKKRILLVEDNADDEELTIRALRKSSIVNEIKVVRDGQEAIDYLLCQHKYKDRDIKDVPVIILLDLKLPKVDGLDVLRRIRGEESISIIPVIMLTSSKEEQDIIRSYRLGVNSYVIKPVDFDRFTEAIQALGVYWLLINEPPITK
jgi:two-component system response regulator